jgi:hypothetical protein
MESTFDRTGGPCWEPCTYNGDTLHCEEVHGHTGNHISGEDALIWNQDGTVVGGEWTKLADNTDE